jgi:hypothetical protein
MSVAWDLGSSYMTVSSLRSIMKLLSECWPVLQLFESLIWAAVSASKKAHLQDWNVGVNTGWKNPHGGLQGSFTVLLRWCLASLRINVIINFMCELDWAIGWPNTCFNIILGFSMKVFLDEIYCILCFYLPILFVQNNGFHYDVFQIHI